MSIGAITIKASRRLDGGMDYTASFAGDNAYPAGGTLAFTDALRAAIKAAAAAASDKNVRGPEAVTILDVQAQDCGAYSVGYVQATGALKVTDTTTGAEAAPAADLSGTTFNVAIQTA